MIKGKLNFCLLLLLILPMSGFASVQRSADGIENFLARDINSGATELGLTILGKSDEKFPLGNQRDQSIATIVARVNQPENASSVMNLIALKSGESLSLDTFFVGTGDAGNGTTIDGGADTNATTGAVGKSCHTLAEEWGKQLSDNHAHAWLVVFNRYGNPCYRASVGSDVKEKLVTPGRVTQGDPLYVGIVGNAEETPKYKIAYSSCDLQPIAPVFEDTISDAQGIRLESSNLKLHKFPPRECYNDSVTVTVKNSKGDAIASDEIKQYGVFRGSFHIGAVNTDLFERTYSTFDFGEGAVIRSSIGDNSGPEYVGSIVIYGLPHYLSSLFGGASYAGRDIINDNQPFDRVGLVLSVGLEKPRDTLGLGLSFELAPGFNLTASQLYRRLTVLDGVAVGDAFAGDTIPTKSDWEHEFVVGISVDGRYLTKFFSGSAENN